MQANLNASIACILLRINGSAVERIFQGFLEWQPCHSSVMVFFSSSAMFVGLVNVNVGRCGQGLYKVKVGGFEGVFGTETGV